MNLSGNKTRNVEQEEQIGRRTSIIDDRRNTRAPALETNANLRSARRGDVGGAEALMRTLGIVADGVNDLRTYTMNKHIDDENEAKAQGAVDAQTGMVDEAMMEKSLGYRNAVTKGRTVNAFTEASREFEEELSAVIEAQDSPDLGERQAEIEQMLEGFYTNFAQDEETGELREFLQSPGAMRYLAEAIGTQRPQALSNAMARVEERFNREALSHYSTYITNEALVSGTVDLDQAMSLLPDTVTDEARAETTLVAVANAAEALRAEGRFEQAVRLLGGLRGRFDTPMDAGAPTASATGTPAAPARNGRVTFEALVERVMFHESRGNPNAVSPVGALGTMQTMPGTLRDPGFGVKPAKDNSPEELERVGKDYLRAMLRRYDGDYVLALAAYNAGPGRADEWKQQLAGSTNARIDAIPFKETRDYVRNIMGDLGLTAPAIETVDPDAEHSPAERLRDPNEDPITAIERSGSIQTIPGLENVTFTPQQQARINELYTQEIEGIRREWQAANAERYSQNATNLALGLFGVDGRVTTMQDITSAFENDELDGEAVMTLIRLHEGREERREAQAERAESRAEREEARRTRRRIEAGSEVVIGRMLRGEITPAEARQAAIIIAGRSNDPEVSGAVLSNVASAAGSYESAIQNSAPVRQAMTEYTELAEDVEPYIATIPGIPQHRRTVAAEQYVEILDRAQSRLLRRIMNGEDPAEARTAVENWVAQQEAAMVEALTPARTAANPY